MGGDEIEWGKVGVERVPNRIGRQCQQLKKSLEPMSTGLPNIELRSTVSACAVLEAR